MKDTEQQWKGYTLDELRVHRIVNLTKIELERTRLNHLTQQYTNKAGQPTPFPIVNKVIGALDFVDYGVLAFRIGKSILSIFRRKKR